MLGARPTTGDSGDGVDRGDSDQAVDDSDGRVRAAELLAENPGDKVEPSDRYETQLSPPTTSRAPASTSSLRALATVEALLSEVIIPYLRELGERWERGEASIAQEHFASAVLRGRVLGLARGWGLGLGP